MPLDIEAFYREHYRMVFGYLLSLCGNRTVAEDLASETFLRALQNIDRYDGCCRLTTWLCRIGRNLYFNECRRSRRHVPLGEAEAAGSPQPEEFWMEREEAAGLLRAAESLPPLQRQVFRMRVSGLRFREIGNALGRSENWARVTFFRAKSRVLEEWEGTHSGV